MSKEGIRNKVGRQKGIRENQRKRDGKGKQIGLRQS